MSNPKLTLYALAILVTSHGHFSPGQVLPLSDMPEEEVDQLEHDETAFLAENDSPFADKAREARAMPDQHRAAEWLREFAAEENAYGKDDGEISLDEPTGLPGVDLAVEPGQTVVAVVERAVRLAERDGLAHFIAALNAGPDAEPLENPLADTVKELRAELLKASNLAGERALELEKLIAASKQPAPEDAAKPAAAAQGMPTGVPPASPVQTGTATPSGDALVPPNNPAGGAPPTPPAS